MNKFPQNCQKCGTKTYSGFYEKEVRLNCAGVGECSGHWPSSRSTTPCLHKFLAAALKQGRAPTFCVFRLPRGNDKSKLIMDI
jgi:hypothetical protein